MGEPWFGPKAYGIGLSPKTPAGWISVAAYMAAMAAARLIGRQVSAPRWAAWLAPSTLTLAFLALVLVKSDRRPWRWRWAGR
jgi:hypothetical protein